MVVYCIYLHERRGCSGASTPVPADDDSSAVRLGSIFPLILSFLPTCISSGISLACPDIFSWAPPCSYMLSPTSWGVKRNFFALFLVISLGLHRIFVFCHSASRCVERNFLSFFLVNGQRHGRIDGGSDGDRGISCDGYCGS